MRIEGSTVQLFGSSTSVEKHTKEEAFKMWVGNTRPVFPGEKSAGLLSVPENIKWDDTLQLSPEGKEALEKQLASANSTGISEDDEDLFSIGDKDMHKIYLLQKMIETLTGKKLKFIMPKSIKLDRYPVDPHILDQRAFKLQPANTQAGQPQTAPAQQRQGWGLEYDLHEAHYKKQTMRFSAEGSVQTADGREIRFDLDLGMSREFASRLDVSIRAGDAVKVDPLVVNFGSPSAALTNNKFSFDLDNDGDTEQISFATGGSGFLALDVNQDGTINNGSELFGPHSGNGFSDLAEYDVDANGWIDENDEIYNRLRIWTKDENGQDKLFALGEKGIGAIYLGNVATAFDLKTNSNQTLGSIAKTGIYLKENGIAGTIQHVDVAI